MRLAISNIAWPAEAEPAVADRLSALGVDRVEIAPAKVFAEPTEVGDRELADVVGFWAERGISIVAMQALLFGHPDLDLFGDSEPELRRRLESVIRLGGRLGATALVFGSPGNRRRAGRLTVDEAFARATTTFRALGRVAADVGTCLCIEPNPVVYGCDFVTTAAEGRRLVEEVDSPGFGLHLDIAGMTLAGDDPVAEIEATGPGLRHFHVSAPELAPIDDGIDHRAAAGALRRIGYEGTISVEMRPDPRLEPVDSVERAIGLARDWYGGV